MELSFGGEDKEDKNSVEIKEFHNKLEQFDSLVKNAIMSKSKEWLGKPKESIKVYKNGDLGIYEERTTNFRLRTTEKIKEIKNGQKCLSCNTFTKTKATEIF
jgi:hypothetical protein